MPKSKKMCEVLELPLSDYEMRGGKLTEEQKAIRREKTKKFFKDFAEGFKKGFTGVMKVGVPIVKEVVGLGGEGEEGETQAPKKRKASAYNEFVKDHYNEVKHLPNKERFAELGKMWKASQ